MQDKKILNVVTLMTGEVVSGSWWSHPRSHEIFRVLEKLGDHPDVLVSRLIAAKITYVHRNLWPSFLGIATSRAKWQTQNLSADARKLLRDIPTKSKGNAARELQERLLVAAEEVHTESGRHETSLESWESWAKRRNVAIDNFTPEMTRELEDAAAKINAPAKLLPWNRK